MCVCLCFVLWDLSSSTKEQTHVPAVDVQSPNHWTTRNFPGIRFSEYLVYIHYKRMRFWLLGQGVGCLRTYVCLSVDWCVWVCLCVVVGRVLLREEVTESKFSPVILTSCVQVFGERSQSRFIVNHFLSYLLFLGALAKWTSQKSYKWKCCVLVWESKPSRHISVHQIEENLICCISSQALYTWAPGKLLPFPLKRSSTIKMGRRNRAVWLASRSISRKLYKSIQIKMQQMISRWWGDVGDGILHPYLFSVSMTPSLAALTHKWIVGGYWCLSSFL